MAKSKEMEIAIKIAGKVENSFKNTLSSVAKGLKNISKTVLGATAAAASAVAGIGIAATNVGREFEGAMSQVAATMLLDKTTEEGKKAFEALEQAARDCGSSTAFSATEAAQALNYLALAGYSADKAAKALPVVLKLAGAGAMDLAAASDMVTDSMSALNIEATEKNLTNFADQLAQTASKSNTSVAQLGEAILTIGGTATDLAGGTTELNTALGILADNGLKASEGGTHLRNMILSLQKARNEDAANLFKKLGLSAYDTEGRMRSLGDVFGDLNKQLEGASAEKVNDTLSTIFKQTDLAAARAMLAATADSVESLGSILDASLADSNTSIAKLGINLENMVSSFDTAMTGEQFAAQMLEQFGMTSEQAGTLFTGLQSIVAGTGNRFEELTQQIENSAGACENMYAIQLDNLNGDIDILKSGLADLGISIYKDLNGPLRGMTQLATNMVGELSAAYSTGGMEGMFATVGNCLSEVVNEIASYAPKMINLGVSLLENFIGGIVENSGTIAATAGEVFSAFVNGLFTLGSELIFAGIDIITQLAQSLIQQLPQIITQGTQAITNFVSGITERLPSISQTAFTLIQTLINSIESNAPQLLEAAIQLISGFAFSLMQALPQLTNMGVELINSLTEGIRNNLPQMIPAAMQTLVSFSSSLRENAGKLVDAGLKMILTLAESFIANIPVFIQTIPTIITNICGIINDNAPKLLVAGIQLIVQLAAGLIQAIPILIENIPQIIQAVISVFTAFNWLSLGGKIVTLIKNGIHSLATAIPKAFQSICTSVKTIIHNVKWSQLGSQIIRFIVNGLKTLVTAIPTTLKNIGMAAVKWFKSIDWLDLGISIIKGIISGLVSMGKNLWNTIKSLFTGGGEEIDVSSTGAAVTQSYAAGINGNTAIVSDAVSNLSVDAFSNIDNTEAISAGTQMGTAFTTSLTNNMATDSFDIAAFNANMATVGTTGATALNMGLNTALSSNSVNVDVFDATTFEADMVAAGTQGAMTFSDSFHTELSEITIDTEMIDTTILNTNLTEAGTQGATAISTGMIDNTQAVTEAAATLGTEINTTLDSSWDKVNTNAQTAMQRLTSTIKNAAQSAANAIKTAFENMTITIPKPKLPVINVSKNSVSYGDGGNVSVPNFSVSWNALGGIFNKPTVFHTPFGMQGVGEAGAEAILPLDMLWSKMKEILNQSLAQNSGTSIIDTFLEKLKTIGTGGSHTPKLAEAGGMTIEWNPTYNIYGSAGKEEIVEANRMSQSEFNKFMKQWEKDNRRKNF